MRPVSTFLIFNCQTPVYIPKLFICFVFTILQRCDFLKMFQIFFNFFIIPSLTVRKSKNRCIPYGYWATAIFAVVADYSILFFPFTFFLNISHFTFCYELIICSETTDVMKIIRNSFSFV